MSQQDNTTSSSSAPLDVDMTSAMTMTNSPPPKSSVASGSAVKSSTLSRRQHAAHRARIVALSKQLTTRLQYATFKVEHGWSKQSLSEVENLYYRHCKASGSSHTNSGHLAASAVNTSSGLSPSSLRKNSVPSTPKFQSRSSAPNSTGPSASKGQSQGQETDVFGGLMTPPASGGNFPIHSDREGFAVNPSFASGLTAQQRSPTAGLEGKGSSAVNKGKSYADFWSKITTAGAGSGNERQ